MNKENTVTIGIRSITGNVNEDKVDNALIGIKNNIRNELYTLQGIRKSLDYLAQSTELWQSLGYAYKGSELCDTAQNELCEIRNSLAPNAKRQRKEVSGMITRARALRDYFHRLNHEHLYGS